MLLRITTASGTRYVIDNDEKVYKRLPERYNPFVGPEHNFTWREFESYEFAEGKPGHLKYGPGPFQYITTTPVLKVEEFHDLSEADMTRERPSGDEAP